MYVYMCVCMCISLGLPIMSISIIYTKYSNLKNLTIFKLEYLGTYVQLIIIQNNFIISLKIFKMYLYIC